MIRALPRSLRGALLSAAGFSLFACGDATVKHLSASYPVAAILFYQLWVILIFLMACSPWLGGLRRTLRSRRKKIHLLRGFLSFFQILAGMYAFSQMPLAKTYSLMFTAPALTVLLALLLMKEPVSRAEWRAILLGFCGVLVVLRPGAIPLELPVAAALASTAMFATINLLARRLKPEEETLLGIGLYQAVVVLVFTAPVFLMNPVLPSAADLPWLALLGVMTATGFLCVSSAFMRAPAAVAAPFHYIQMLWAIIFGWLFFGDRLDLWTGAGAAIVIASGFLLLKGKKPPPETASPPL